MPKREYRQYCSAAKALDLLGERWTLLLVRELLTGPRRYSDLLSSLHGIGTNLLAARLKSLENSGVIERRHLLPPAASSVYALTARGEELEPLIVELARWGLPLMGDRQADETWRAEWTVLALQARFRPEAAEGVREAYQFDVDGTRFFARVRDGIVETGRGTADDAAITLSSDAETFLAVAQGKLGLQEAVDSGAYRIEGDGRALRRCLEIFAAPEA